MGTLPQPVRSAGVCRASTRLLALTVLLAGLAAAPAPARAGDSSIVWRTLHTEHFRVHCARRLLPLCHRVAAAAEEGFILLTPRLGWAPATPVEIRVVDSTDSANGLASSLPYNRIVVYAVPPEPQDPLGSTDDWLRLLVYHELTHIVHLDQATGLPALVNRGLGRTVLPNVVLPRWLQEGIAVWQESNLTGAGRVRSALYKGQLRTAALAGALPPADWMSALPDTWPRGSAWYLYGSSFVAYLVEQHGEAALAEFVRLYGQDLIPYGINRTANEAFGETLEEAWESWRRSLTRWAQDDEARRRAEGLVQGVALTQGGERRGGPRCAPDGRLLYYHHGPDERGLLRLRRDAAAPGEGRRLLEPDGWAGAAWDPDGQSLVLSQLVVQRGLYAFHDLYRCAPATDRCTRLTEGLRAREPDVGSDGRIAFLGTAGGKPRLLVADRDGRGARELPLPGLSLPSGPRFSPDGRTLAVSAWRDASRQRDLYLVPSDGSAPPRRITHDRSIDLAPSWSPDGRRLYFSSDRGGVFDLFAYELETGAVRRITRVLGGAFEPEPTPDGESLVYVALGAGGYDLRRVDLAGLELPLSAASDGGGRPEPTLYPADQPATEDRPYSALPSLLPRAFSPTFGADGEQGALGVLVAAQDAAALHAYAAQVQWDQEHTEPTVLVSYSYRRFFPTLSLTGSRSVSHYAQGYIDGEGWAPYDEERLAASLGASVPFSIVRSSQSLGLRYGLTRYRGLTPLELRDPAGRTPRYPFTGVLAGLSLTWTLTSLERFPLSISTARGTLLSLALTARDPALGSDRSSLSATGVGHVFFPMPWSRHHVLGLRVAGGLASGEPGSSPGFSIGGPPTQDIVRALIDETFVSSSGYLRGYPPGAATGTRFATSNLELRIPLLRVERGLGLLPVYLKRVLAVPFVDHGAASSEQLTLDDLKRGVGAELRADLTFGYYIEASLRLGYAWGLSEGGEDQLYVLLGNVF